MATLTLEAQSQMARYLRQVRAALRGHRSIDPDDVERDVRGHIDAELVGCPEPIDEGELQRVLDRLGAPSQWAPADEQHPWWAAVDRLRDGPEEWRLAYLTLALAVLGVTLFIAGPVLWPLPLLMPIVAYFLGRATLELLEHHGEPIGARRWLIYPVLVPIALGFAALLLLWPLELTVGAIVETPAIRDWVARVIPGPWWASTPAIGALALGLWWTCLGLIVRRVPGAVRATFRPLADEFERRHATRVALAGVVLAVAGASLLVTIVRP